MSQLFGSIKIISLLSLLLIIGCEAGLVRNRIIDGNPASTGQFPWHVVLKKDAIDDLLCGGSVISNQWVLTAAHCTYQLPSIYMMFGSLQLENDDAVSMTSSVIFIHPEYNKQYLNNDVSLILLPSPLTFSNTIQPIQIVPSNLKSSSFEGTVATIAGFGLTDDEYLEDSESLLYATVQVINNNQCLSVYGQNVVLPSTMCARGYDLATMSICSGDSGGALVAKAANGNYMQIGINSFVAQDQCTEGLPSGYVRLTSFIDYIASVTGLVI